MTVFPSLAPSVRTFTPGEYIVSGVNRLSGRQTRIRTSLFKQNQTLRLTFTALTEADMLNIRVHYSLQRGSFYSFEIPNALLQGMDVPSSFTPGGYQWIYASSPNIEDIGLRRYTVSVELKAIPFESANTNGRQFRVVYQYAPGAATGEANAAGANFTVTITIVDDIPFGDVTFSSPPASWPSVVASIPEFGEAVGLAGGFVFDPFNLVELGYEFDFNLSEDTSEDVEL